MNLRTLGTLVATLVKDNADQRRIFTDAINTVQSVIDKIEDVGNEVITGYEEAGGTWSDAVQPEEEDSLSLKDMLEHIAKNHPESQTRSAAGVIVSNWMDDTEKNLEAIRTHVEQLFEDSVANQLSNW